MARNANLTFNVCFAGPVGILSPVDTGYGSGDGKVALSVDDPGHACIEIGENELQDNGNCFMFDLQSDLYVFAICDENYGVPRFYNKLPFSVEMLIKPTFYI